MIRGRHGRKDRVHVLEEFGPANRKVFPAPGIEDHEATVWIVNARIVV